MTDRDRQDRIDIHQRVTSAIVAAIERGRTRYRMSYRLPWHHDGAPTSRPVNAVSGKGYRGANTLLLWAAAEANGYPTGRWATYRGWVSLGAQVRKGERSTTVVFWKAFRREDDGSEVGAAMDGDDDQARPRLMARGYFVFNEAQVDGCEPPAATPLDEAERHAGADAFFAHLNIPLVIGGDQAFHRPSTIDRHDPHAGLRAIPGLAGLRVRAHARGWPCQLTTPRRRRLFDRRPGDGSGIRPATGETTMASTIANLTRTPNGGYKGTLMTLTTKAPIELQPNTRKQRDEEPDFRVVGTSNGFELGGAWIRKSRSSDGDYVSVSLSAPEFNGKMYANVAPAPGGKENEFVRIWNGRD